MEVKYNKELDVFYLPKDFVIDRMTEVLEKVLSPLKGMDLYNTYNIVRQDFLTLCEDPDELSKVFGTSSLSYYDEEDDDYYWINQLESEVVNRVIKELGLKDVELETII